MTISIKDLNSSDSIRDLSTEELKITGGSNGKGRGKGFGGGFY